MLECDNIKKIYLVDPYKAFSLKEYNAGHFYLKRKKRLTKKYLQKAFDRHFRRARRRLSSFEKDRYLFVRKTSKSASAIIDDELDFVYIDGNHKYDYVREDIHIWFSKLKDGGLLFGHDWVSDPSIGDYKTLKGVLDAVLEFTKEHQSQLADFASEDVYKCHYTKVVPGLYVTDPVCPEPTSIWCCVKAKH